MLVNASQYLEPIILNMLLRNTGHITPSASYLALFTAFTEADDGTTLTEVSGGAYARQALTFAAPDSDGKAATSAAVNFPAATASWGSVTYLGIYDAITSGNLLYWGKLSAGITVDIDTQFSVPSAGLTVQHVGSLSANASTRLLNRFLRNTAFTAIATPYAALLTAYTSDSVFTEVTGGAYARQALTFGAPSGNQVQNSVAVDFGLATGADWGIVTHFAIFDASSAGNMIFRKALSASRTIVEGRGFKQAIGDLTVTME